MIDRQDAKEMVEHMHHVTCYMQEEQYYLLPDGREAVRHHDGTLMTKGMNGSKLVENTQMIPMQIVRYLWAEDASYYYKKDRFIAKNVTLARFVAPGHALVQSIDTSDPLFFGTAQSVEFSLFKQDPRFIANKLKAAFQNVGGL